MAEKKIMYRQRARKVFGEEKYVVGFVTGLDEEIQGLCL